MVPVYLDMMQFRLDFTHSPFVAPRIVHAMVKTRRGFREQDIVIRQRRETSCRIVQVHSEQGGAMVSYTEVGVGTAKCASEDNFSKEIGRRKALAYAFKNARAESPMFAVKNLEQARYVAWMEQEILKQYEERPRGDRKGKRDVQSVLVRDVADARMESEAVDGPPDGAVPEL